MSSSKLSGILAIIGGTVIHLMLGNIYLWGNISGYVVAYFHKLGDQHANKDNAVFVIPLSFVGQTLFNPVGAYLQKRMNPKIILSLGSSIVILSVYLSSYTKSWDAFLIIYAVIFPIGIGICYYTPLMCGWEHLPSKKGAVSGLVIGGFGFGAFIFGFISTAIANPDNLKKVKEDPSCTGDDCESYFPEEVSDKVP